MTDRELLAFFKNKGTVCGRFYEGQLNRPVTALPVPQHSGWMQIIISMGLYLGFSTGAFGQKRPSVPNTVMPGDTVASTTYADSTLAQKQEAKELKWNPQSNDPKKITMGFYVAYPDYRSKQQTEAIKEEAEEQKRGSVPSLYRKFFPLKKPF